MEYCKGCGSKELVKNGKSAEGSQRYKCKTCGSTFRSGDKRLKYGLEVRIKVIKMYLEGVGIRSIERLENVSNPLIIYWIRHFSKLMRQEILRAKIPDKIEEIEILEIDELFTYYKKKENRAYAWLAVDRNRNQIIDIQVSKSRDFSSYFAMVCRIEKSFNIKVLCTNVYEVYAKYKLASRHVVTKVETSLVESKNSLIRHYLARFNRKTKRYSKAIDMIENSLLLLFNKDLLKSIVI